MLPVLRMLSELRVVDWDQHSARVEARAPLQESWERARHALYQGRADRGPDSCPQ